MATVAQCVTLTNVSGQNEISDSDDFAEGIGAEVLGAFSVEGTHKEPSVGQIWPRLA